MPTPIIASLLAGILTLFLGLVMLRWAPRLGLIDLPDTRKRHRALTPLGGIAPVLASSISALIFIHWDPRLIGWLLGAMGVSAMGLVDDRWELGPQLKLLWQIICALPLILGGGFLIESISLLGIEVELGIFSSPFSLLWIVGITNAFNLIDGLDGLAIGAVLASSAAAATISLQTGNEVTLVLAATLLGGAAGFLIFNWQPAKLFLGDAGSFYLGFMLALITIAALKSDGTPLREIPILIPTVLLLYPIADTLWAIVRRIRAKRPIFSPDREHLHHQLFNLGWGYPKVILTFYGIFAVLALLALVQAR